jgi:dipeptidase E
MKRIVAIGGGEIGRPSFPIETAKIDKEIIRLTGKKNPRLLFLPTASSDSELYHDVVQKYFGKKLGCKVKVLNLIREKFSQKEIKEKILSSDIIYVGGGNTLKMMKVWRKMGVDKILKLAHEKGIVLSGLSAGSICWFKYGSSDSRREKNPKADLIKVSGLGLIQAVHCPHYHFEKDRRADLKKMMKKTAGVAIALDNCSAIEVVGEKYRIITSKSSANAYKVYWKNNKYHEEKIKEEKEFKPLKELLKK